MIATLSYMGINRKVDFSNPIDISRAITNGGTRAWGVGEPGFIPVQRGDWVGEVKKGASVNFRDVVFNPHAHGTHTECVGHISKEDYSVNQCLKQFMFFAKLITVLPRNNNGDKVIDRDSIAGSLIDNKCEALIIRTSRETNEAEDYSNTNPPFIQQDAITIMLEKGIQHLLIDTPSVDKESDGGLLLAHRAFWEYPLNTKKFRTITELVQVSDKIKDGDYLLNLQVAAFENDASPSRPVLYELMN